MLSKVNLAEKFAAFHDHWRPRIIATLNGQEVKLVKLAGQFVWHKHPEEDELFLCVAGRFRVELREQIIEIEPGELVVVPRGVEHRTAADEEAEVLVFEPAGTRNTGNIMHPAFTTTPEWL